MKITSPTPGANFTISSACIWPSIEFKTDATGAHTWEWTISWGTFKKSGKVNTPDNRWQVGATLNNLGGSLTVKATVGAANASVTVNVKGTNPTEAEVTSYLATQLNSSGFDKIIGHESKFKHFNANNEPKKSFDNGYGMCQLTNPAPSYEQVWSWKRNVDGGLVLFGQKRTAAVTYLSQSNRSYTADQLLHETVARWNGGHYHEWEQNKGWVRPAHILCDSATGNIGWDMNKPENTGKTESDLHARDKGLYSSAPQAGAGWGYFGVCYADSLLD